MNGEKYYKRHGDDDVIWWFVWVVVESFHTVSLTSLWLLLLAPSPNPTNAEPTSRDAGIIAGIIVCVALLVALILVVIFYRSVPNSALYC